MTFRGKNVVVTGGASGIGAALTKRFRTSGAKVCVVDQAQPSTSDDHHFICDVANETALVNAINDAQSRMGGIDVFVSNAGVLSDQPDDPTSASNDEWVRCWTVNVMAHVYAARHVLPSMIARGSGHFVIIASAAGLLNQIGDAAYSATKHAAVSFGESLAISHGPEGINVSVACPQYVATPLIGASHDDVLKVASLMTADDVAQSVMDAMEAGRFLVLPHPQVAKFTQHRARDHDHWIKGMQSLRAQAIEEFGDAKPKRFFKLL